MLFDPAATRHTARVVRVAWSPAAQTGGLYARDMPTAPDGQAYELWAINEDDAVPMGVLDDADDGTMQAVVSTPSHVTTWGVTIEPEQVSRRRQEPSCSASAPELAKLRAQRTVELGRVHQVAGPHRPRLTTVDSDGILR